MAPAGGSKLEPGPEDDVSADRKSKITRRETCRKNGLSASGLSVAAFERLGGETVDIELAAHHSIIELVSKSESGTGIFNAETRRKNWVGPQAGKA
jgi:hypothetical protein